MAFGIFAHEHFHEQILLHFRAPKTGPAPSPHRTPASEPPTALLVGGAFGFGGGFAAALCMLGCLGRRGGAPLKAAAEPLTLVADEARYTAWPHQE